MGQRQRANLLGLPAASEIVNCHSGCRQTTKTDIICSYYPLLLKQPSKQPPLLSSLFSFFTPFPSDIFFFLSGMSTCTYRNSLIYFLYISLLSLLSHCLLSIDEMSQLAVYSPFSLSGGSLPLHRRQRAFRLFSLFLPVYHCNPLHRHNELSHQPQDSIRLPERIRISINMFQLSFLPHPPPSTTYTTLSP